MHYCINSLLEINNEIMQYCIIINDIALIMHYRALLKGSDYIPYLWNAGIGAVAFLDLLEKHLGLDSHEKTAEKMIELQKKYWPEAKRPFQPIDIGKKHALKKFY